jgi:LPXTG-site transpeptidase (sortase) family protein
MKKLLIVVGGLVCLGLVVVTVQLVVPKVIADAEFGLSPFTALPLQDGRNVGVLAPGESRWYELASGTEGAFQRQMDLTLFFTPDDGARAHWVNFQIFSADQIALWYGGDASQMQNLGAGGIVSRDGNPVTGELLWSGWIVNNETYYLQVSNGVDVTIDYSLFTGDIVAAELGPAPEPPPSEEVVDVPDVPDVPNVPDSNPVADSPPIEDVPEEASVAPLLPQASEQGNDYLLGESVGGDVPVGVPTRLEIPAIALDSGVVPVDKSPVVVDGKIYGQWNTTDNLVGWHNLSAQLGQVGNIVLNGHGDVDAAVFRNLGYVRIGDEIIISSGAQHFRYVVTQKFLVQEGNVPLEVRVQNAAWIAPTQDERLTLITCANPGATHRLILIAQP